MAFNNKVIKLTAITNGQVDGSEMIICCLRQISSDWQVGNIPVWCSHFLPALMLAVWFTGCLDRKGAWVGTLQFAFPPQRGGESPTSEGNTRNFTNRKSEMIQKWTTQKRWCKFEPQQITLALYYLCKIQYPKSYLPFDFKKMKLMQNSGEHRSRIVTTEYAKINRIDFHLNVIFPKSLLTVSSK